MKRIAIVLGTRPEVIKMSPVVGTCRSRKGTGLDYFMSRTGQDCSCDIGWVFSGGLGLPDARYNLDVGAGAWGRRHGAQTGRMVAGMA